MIEALGLSFLGFLPPSFFYIALVAWTAAFFGLALELLARARSLRR